MNTIIPIENIVKIEYNMTRIYAKYVHKYINFLGLKIPIKTGFYTTENNYVSRETHNLNYSLVYDQDKNIINTKPYCEIFYKHNNNYTISIEKYFNSDNELEIYIDSIKKSIDKKLISISY